MRSPTDRPRSSLLADALLSMNDIVIPDQMPTEKDRLIKAWFNWGGTDTRITGTCGAGGTEVDDGGDGSGTSPISTISLVLVRL